MPPVRDARSPTDPTQVVATCTASCRPLPSPRARYAPFSGPRRDRDGKSSRRFSGNDGASRCFESRPGARKTRLRGRPEGAFPTDSPRDLRRERGDVIRVSRVPRGDVVARPARARERPAVRGKKEVRRLISPLPSASIAGHPGLQGVRARLPRRGSPPRRHQGSRRCQGPHLRHEVPHQDPAGHRPARRRRGCHPRPPWCVPSRATARPTIAAHLPLRPAPTPTSSLTPTPHAFRRPQRRALGEDRHAPGARRDRPPPFLDLQGLG